jgi:demethylmenaquinone methyltransferase / 2-methoxy-6-polyprenyl-1,4-benzoquinol methylase
MKTTNGSGAMFDGIAGRYDLLNRLTSMGLDRLWRQKAIDALNLTTGQTLLDLAAGTLDISIAANRKYPGIQIIAADPSRRMLEAGLQKCPPHNADSAITVFQSTGEHLPLAPKSIHAAIIAFGIRNFSDRAAALRQLSMSLVPGGRMVILELSLHGRGLLAPLASAYVRTVIPLMGRLLSKGAAYTYLPESMQKFPPPVKFARELAAADFELINIIPFLAGTCNLFICESRRESAN